MQSPQENTVVHTVHSTTSHENAQRGNLFVKAGGAPVSSVFRSWCTYNKTEVDRQLRVERPSSCARQADSLCAKRMMMIRCGIVYCKMSRKQPYHTLFFLVMQNFLPKLKNISPSTCSVPFYCG